MINRKKSLKILVLMILLIMPFVSAAYTGKGEININCDKDNCLILSNEDSKICENYVRCTNPEICGDDEKYIYGASFKVKNEQKVRMSLGMFALLKDEVENVKDGEEPTFQFSTDSEFKKWDQWITFDGNVENRPDKPGRRDVLQPGETKEVYLRIKKEDAKKYINDDNWAFKIISWHYEKDRKDRDDWIEIDFVDKLMKNLFRCGGGVEEEENEVEEEVPGRGGIPGPLGNLFDLIEEFFFGNNEKETIERNKRVKDNSPLSEQKVAGVSIFEDFYEKLDLLEYGFPVTLIADSEGNLEFKILSIDEDIKVNDKDKIDEKLKYLMNYNFKGIDKMVITRIDRVRGIGYSIYSFKTYDKSGKISEDGNFAYHDYGFLNPKEGLSFTLINGKLLEDDEESDFLPKRP